MFVANPSLLTADRNGLVLVSPASTFGIEFVDDIHGETVPLEALPAKFGEEMPQSKIGSWRADMNAINKSVAQHKASMSSA